MRGPGVVLSAIRLILVACAMMGAALPARTAWAQDEDTPPAAREARIPEREPEPQPGPVDPSMYVLGPGDILEIVAWGRLNLQYAAEVDPEGRVYLRDVGPIPVAGLTLEEGRKRILSGYRRILSGVSVDIRLKTVRKAIVYVTGAVNTPGAIEANGVTRVSQVIAKAGGLAPTASTRNIRLQHRTGDSLRVDLTRFERLGDVSRNPFVSGGDVIWVPPRLRFVSAQGAVAIPGQVEFVEGETVGDLLRLAGGLKPSADAGGTYLLRYRNETQYDTLAVQLSGTDPPDGGSLLQDRDRVFVRERGDWKVSRTVRVTGEIASPGTYAIENPTMRISEVIAQAGGFTADAARHKVLLFRAPPASQRSDPEFDRLQRLSRSEMTDAEYQVFKTKLASQNGVHLVDFRKIESGDRAHDIAVQEGDSIVVDRLERMVRLGGEVRAPGLVEYERGLRAGDYVKRAGGFSARASKGKMRLTRASSGQTVLVRDAGEIQPGDFIWVPEKREINGWALTRDLIAVAGNIAAIIFVVTR